MEYIKDIILELTKVYNPDNPISFLRECVGEYWKDKINKMIKNCNDCQFCSKHKSLICGSTKSASILILSDFLHKEQIDNSDKNYIYPFENTEAFSILNDYIFNRINKNAIILANSINCYPYYLDKNNKDSFRPPNFDEIKNCKVFLNWLIDIARPRYILIMGKIALRSLTNENIDFHSWIDIQCIPSLLTFNPINLIVKENDSEFKKNRLTQQQELFIKDIDNFIEKIKEDYPNSYQNILVR